MVHLFDCQNCEAFAHVSLCGGRKAACDMEDVYADVCWCRSQQDRLQSAY
jgi:hypothetical protein